MTESLSTVFLVDDDAGVLKALSRLLRARGYDIKVFTSPQAFLTDHDASIPGCAVLDVSMPGLDGLELQQALTAGGSQRPVIFLTGKGDIPTSVRAMRAGAIDFLTKPVSDADLLAAITRAEKDDASTRHSNAELDQKIAGDLGTVEKTIKVHRGRVMEKLGVRSVADLVRLAEKAGISPAKL